MGRGDKEADFGSVKGRTFRWLELSLKGDAERLSSP